MSSGYCAWNLPASSGSSCHGERASGCGPYVATQLGFAGSLRAVTSAARQLAHRDLRRQPDRARRHRRQIVLAREATLGRRARVRIEIHERDDGLVGETVDHHPGPERIAHTATLAANEAVVDLPRERPDHCHSCPTAARSRPPPARRSATSCGTRSAPASPRPRCSRRSTATFVDLSRTLDRDTKLEVLTAKSPEALETIRHDAAHIVADAVQRLFPGTQVTIGPAIEDGFYYDFYRGQPFTEDELAADRGRARTRSSPRTCRSCAARSRVDEAIKLFDGKGEKFKVEIIQDIVAQGRQDAHALQPRRLGRLLPRARTARRPAKVGVIKILSSSAAYWRGDHRNKTLQRDLRHRVLRQEGPRRVAQAARRGREARPPPARQGARPVPLPPVRRRARRSGRRRAPRSTRCCRRTCATSRCRTATSRSRRRCSTTRACGRSAATGASTRRTCSSSRTARRRPRAKKIRTTSRSSR